MRKISLRAMKSSALKIRNKFIAVRAGSPEPRQIWLFPRWPPFGLRPLPWGGKVMGGEGDMKDTGRRERAVNRRITAIPSKATNNTTKFKIVSEPTHKKSFLLPTPATMGFLFCGSCSSTSD